MRRGCGKGSQSVAKAVPFQTLPRRPPPEELDAFVSGAKPGGDALVKPEPAGDAPEPAPAATDEPEPLATAHVTPAARAKKGRAPVPEPSPVMKRLTFDIPADLHKRMKLACVEAGVDMAEELRSLIAKRFPLKS